MRVADNGQFTWDREDDSCRSLGETGGTNYETFVVHKMIMKCKEQKTKYYKYLVATYERLEIGEIQESKDGEWKSYRVFACCLSGKKLLKVPYSDM